MSTELVVVGNPAFFKANTFSTTLVASLPSV